MIIGWLCFGLFVLVLATRSRLERAEAKARADAASIAKLAATVADQAKRVAALEEQVDLLAAWATALATPPTSDSPTPSAAARAVAAEAATPPLAAVPVPDPVAVVPLPPSAAGASRRSAADASLPRSAADASLPGSAAEASLPRSPADASLPRSAADASLPQSALDASLPRPAADASPPRSAQDTPPPSAAGTTPPTPPKAYQPPPRPAQPAHVYAATSPDPVDATLAFLRELFFGGNTVVRAGIVIVLIGVVLLLRWAAEHALFPIELRLLAVALVAICFTIFGYRQRAVKPGFAVTLQGGGVAALYLVVFFAYRSYGLLPPGLAFALLSALALASGVLAVAQDAASLLFIGQLFGFAAPLLAATGNGSHVALFSYYLVLNVLVCGVAFFKAWHALNLLGFLFTFGVATSWGVLRYEARLFASTEPFLLAFFGLYVAIPVLFALRHPSAPRGWVDGSVVFGTPLATLGLQWALVHERAFGMAYSVLALGAVYLGLAASIKRRAHVRLAGLGEAFLPIGVGFATLAIPYGFDNHNLTGAAWALEGAGLYWVGVRQRRWLSRAAGAGLQLLAGGALAVDPLRGAGSLPVLNSWFLAGALSGSAALFIARYAHACRSRLPSLEWQAAQLLIVWGVGFWLRACFGEVRALVDRNARPGVELFALALLALALETLARRLAWLPGRIPALLLWPAMAVYLSLYAWQLEAQPLSHSGWLGWPVLAFAMLTVLRKFVDGGPPQLRSLHALTLWLWSLWFVLLAERVSADALKLDASFTAAAGNMMVVLALLIVLQQTRAAGWPFGVHKQHSLQVSAAGLVLYAAWRGLEADVTLPGSAAPLPYLPILNPLDVTALLAFVLSVGWLRRLRAETPPLCSEFQAHAGYASVAGLGFAWWNALLARSVHHYTRVVFDPDALLASSALQLSFSLSWTLIALTVMIIAHRTRVRAPWLVSAGLLAIVIGKLFLLDLEQLSTPTKIASFLGVGALLLLVGYVAPVPSPKASAVGAEV